LGGPRESYRHQELVRVFVGADGPPDLTRPAADPVTRRAGVVLWLEGAHRVAEQIVGVRAPLAERIPLRDVGNLRDVRRPDERIGVVTVGAGDAAGSEKGYGFQPVMAGVGGALLWAWNVAAVASLIGRALKEAGLAGALVVLDDGDVVERRVIRPVAGVILAADHRRLDVGVAGAQPLEARKRHARTSWSTELNRLVARRHRLRLRDALPGDRDDRTLHAVEGRNLAHLRRALLRVGKPDAGSRVRRRNRGGEKRDRNDKVFLAVHGDLLRAGRLDQPVRLTAEDAAVQLPGGADHDGVCLRRRELRRGVERRMLEAQCAGAESAGGGGALRFEALAGRRGAGDRQLDRLAGLQIEPPLIVEPARLFGLEPQLHRETVRAQGHLGRIAHVQIDPAAPVPTRRDTCRVERFSGLPPR